MRLVFIAFAGHAFTDNVLISTPACVMFAFATAVFARRHRAPNSLARFRACGVGNGAIQPEQPGHAATFPVVFLCHFQ